MLIAGMNFPQDWNSVAWYHVLDNSIFINLRNQLNKIRMKVNGYTLTMYLATLCSGFTLKGQTGAFVPEPCRASEFREAYFNLHPQARLEQEARELLTNAFVEDSNMEKKTTRATKYTIPCVFHVYGAKQGGKDVTLAVIESALKEWANKDFTGKNDDYGSVHSKFMSLRDSVSITFALAKKDPSGNPTTGMVMHPVEKGFANATGYDDKIQADAWDNYRYMNFYIMNDLYNDGNLNNSGSSTPPISSIADMKLARVVYNGAFLGSNTVKEFASVITHEIGHFFNLMHTFDQGCKSLTNDLVDDTPAEDYDSKTPCHTSATANAPLNCKGELLNVENYMDYVGPNGCYKMFTKGQVQRMKTALEQAPLKSLWQPENLIKTGLLSGTIGIMENSDKLGVSVYPNPGAGIFNLELSVDSPALFQITVMDIIGNVVASQQTESASGNITRRIDLSSLAKGVYFLSVRTTTAQQLLKIVKQE